MSKNTTSFDVAVDMTVTFVIKGVKASSKEEAEAIAKVYAKQDCPPELGKMWSVDSCEVEDAYVLEDL